MATDDAVSGPNVSTWDPLIHELRSLRRTAGDPSYGRIAELIVERRVASGASPGAAHVARSTVFDTFRIGRPRANLALVREAAIVLGADDMTVDRWINACQSPQTEEPDEPNPARATKQVVVMLTCCLVLNLGGRAFVDFFNLPIYLDMIGTAIAAMALGPWHGAAVGAATNLVGVTGSGWISAPFLIVNVAGALMWGYGVRRLGMGRTLPRFFSLNVLTALVCTSLATPIIVLSGLRDLRVGQDVITQLVQQTIDTFVLAAGLSNLLTSTGDKLISGFVALVVISALPHHLRCEVPLAMTAHRHDGQVD